MANLSYGSYGDEVRKLQNALNRVGYSLDVDGGFGRKTQAAVLDYQVQNGLRLKDGVVGNETWGSLANQSVTPAAPQTGAAVRAGVSQDTIDALAKLEQGYAPSQETDAAQANLDSVNSMRPNDFTSQYTSELHRLYDQIAGRKAFSYDPGKDAAFAQYAQEYTRQGKQAMEDTVGRSAALSGGYASSYAQTAGQQSYQSYLQRLYDLLPQLSEKAREQYDREGDQLNGQYALLQKQDSQAYDRWRDTAADWNSAQSAAYKQYESARSKDADDYKVLLNYYADKAAAEQKAAAEGAVNNSGAAHTAPQNDALSSVAYGSLSGAMGNYLKAGQYGSAAALWGQYQERMTAGQKQSLSALFQKYGYQI